MNIVGRVAIGLVSAILLAAVLPGTASAAPAGEFTTFDLGPAGYSGNAIAAGPDGNMWFTNNAKNSIGVITPKGSVRYFPVPTDASQTSGSGLFDITAGPDGNMWFTGFYANFVGKVTPNGVITLYPVPLAESHPLGITAGVDGNLWFTLDFANGIGRITPAGVITLFPIPTAGVEGIVVSGTLVNTPNEITAGPLDSLWFTMPAANLIGRMTMAGVVTTYPSGTVTPSSTAATNVSLGSITTGANGFLYFAESAAGKIGQMTPDGVVTTYALSSAAQPWAITPGPADTLWFNEAGANALGNITVPGAKVAAALARYPNSTANSTPGALATGADGNVWFVNVVSPSSGVFNLQIGTISTGYGRLLSAKVLGDPKVGSTLTCSKTEGNTWPGIKTRYHWLRNGQVIAGAQSRTFTPAKADKGDKIGCRVSVTYGVTLNQLGANAKAVTIKP
ncbi:MAG: hypothetical protein KGN78_09275 [Actinomycetales bacterium]|nr:hypothetical protein [Actinomycetales bacterium]